MPPSSLSAVLALVSLFHLLAAAQSDQSIIVWGSAVFVRSGEHTTSTNALAPSQLTPLGANQAYQVGKYLRGMYLFEHPIPNLNVSLINDDEIYVLATDDSQFGPASATAILQGLYPPLNGSDVAGWLDPLGVMAHGHYIQNPLNGYQYPWIHTAGSSDSDSIYVNGAEYCTLWSTYEGRYFDAALASSVENETHTLYSEVGKLLSNPELEASEYGYWNAYAAFEEVSYLYKHDTNGSLELDLVKRLNGLNRLRWLADEYLWNLYGNPAASIDPINTIAGQTLAAKIVDVLSINIGSYGQQNKLSILVGDYAPLISFFGLADLQVDSSNFTGMPDWGSMAAFELYSPANITLYSGDNGDQSPYPFLNHLHVRFVFRNGTTESALQRPLFGSDKLNMTWNDFEMAMRKIQVSSVGEWCGACDSWMTSPFCLFYNQTALNAVSGLEPTNQILPTLNPSLSPVAAGVIGAGVTIGVLALLLVLAVLLCGLRFSIAKPESKEGTGGFKGNQKMASDADLTTLKGTHGATTEGQDTKERVGSWELKQRAAAANPDGTHGNLRPEAGAQSTRPLSFVSSIRRSFDTHDPVHNPFQDPVKPDERV